MNEPGLAAVCGTSCGACRFHPTSCAGCGTVSGKPFWVKNYGREVCRLYDCAVNQKGLTHCGECAELPCALFMESSDPALAPEQAEASRNKRIVKLKNLLESKEGDDNSQRSLSSKPLHSGRGNDSQPGYLEIAGQSLSDRIPSHGNEAYRSIL